MNAAQNKPLVVVTGSSGLIGTRLINRLKSEYRIVGIDVKPPEIKGAPWIACDLTDDASLRKTLAELRQRHGERIASVVHLAAYYDFSGEPSPLYRTLTVDGTRRLLRGLRDFTVEQFVFSSTLLVMQPVEPGEALTPDSPVEAAWDYPMSKLAAEEVIRQERGSISALVLRIAGAYDEDGHSPPIAHHISRIHQRQLESYFFPGDKTHGQSFVHLDDLAECFHAAIARRGQLPPFETLLIGEEDVMSFEELQERIGELIHGRQWPTIRIPKIVAKAGAWVQEKLAASEDQAPFIRPWMIDLADLHYPVDIERARELLAWSTRHTLRDTLPEMVERLHADPRQWYETNGLPVPEDLLQTSQESPP